MRKPEILYHKNHCKINCVIYASYFLKIRIKEYYVFEVNLEMSSFMPKPYKRELISVRIKPDHYNKINKLALQYDMSRNEIINQCIEFALSHVAESQKPAEK